MFSGLKRCVVLVTFLILFLGYAQYSHTPLNAEAAVQENIKKTEVEKEIDEETQKAEELVAKHKSFLEFMGQFFPESWLKANVFGVAYWKILAAFIFILFAFVFRKISKLVFTKRLIPLLKKSPWEIDNLLAEAAVKPVGWVLLIVGFWLAIEVLIPPEMWDFAHTLASIMKILVAATITLFLFKVVDLGTDYLNELSSKSDSKLDSEILPLVRKALKATILVVIFVWVVQLLGYSVSSLLAGLGIGGLAVALALQDTLGNFFGSVFIFLDQPFKVGDWVKMQGIEGTVENIGFRSTRIRTFPKSLITIPNKIVASSTIDNWSKMPKRRVKQYVGVTYETTAYQMEKAVEAIRELLREDEGVDQDFMLIRFTDFGPSSLDILIYYFTKSIVWDTHLSVRERINIKIMKALEKLDLSIAFPTQTVYFEGDIAKDMAKRGITVEEIDEKDKN